MDWLPSRPLSRPAPMMPSRNQFLCCASGCCVSGMSSSFSQNDAQVVRASLDDDVDHLRRVCLGLFLAMIDTSIVATSLYIIGIEFNDLDNVNWIALAYTLAYMGCAVVFSRISDIVGRRNAFVAAYVLFFAFSLACGWARNMSQMIAFRAVQGVGGSGLYSLTMIMLPEMSPEHLTQHIGAMVGLVVAVSGVLGPVLGGVLTRYASWRWVFWIKYVWPPLGPRDPSRC